LRRTTRISGSGGGCPSKEKAPEPQQRTIRDHQKASEAIKEQLPPGSLPPGQAGAVRAIQKGLENAERRQEGRVRAAEAEAGQAPSTEP
jgi:hypothetical protein